MFATDAPFHFMDFLYAEPLGQTWVQFAELSLAFILSSVIGLEREFRAKSAGLRTHTLVGVAVGMACGAGLPLLAIFVTVTHFLVVYGIHFMVSGRRGVEALVVAIADIKGVTTAKVAAQQAKQ